MLFENVEIVRAERDRVTTRFSKGYVDSLVGLKLEDETIITLQRRECDPTFFSEFEKGILQIRWDGPKGRSWHRHTRIYYWDGNEYKRASPVELNQG